MTHWILLFDALAKLLIAGLFRVGCRERRRGRPAIDVSLELKKLTLRSPAVIEAQLGAAIIFVCSIITFLHMRTLLVEAHRKHGPPIALVIIFGTT